MAGIIEETQRRDEIGDAMPRHRRRPRRSGVVITATVTVVALAVGAIWLGANVVYYQPLVDGGNTDLASNASVVVSLRAGDDVEIIPVVPGGEFAIWTQVRNEGHRPVRIMDIEPQWGVFSIFVPVGTVMGDGTGNEHIGGLPSGTVPFEPFTLAPGESKLVGTRHQFHDCLPVDRAATPLAERRLGDLQLRSTVSWSDQTLRFTVAGWERTVTMPVHPRPMISWDRPFDAEWDPECPGFVELP
jgi:hypothetical protein